MTAHGHGHHEEHGHEGHAGDGAAERNFDSKSDNEWGKKITLYPNTGAGVGGTRTAFGAPQRFVNVQGKVKSTQMVTVCAFATPTADPTNPQFPIAQGPLVATLEYAGGGGGGLIEFDVPCPGAFPGGFAVDFILNPTQGGGAMVSVPASVIQLAIRNDANLAPNGPGFGFAGQAGFQTLGTPLDGNGNPIGAIVQAVCGYGTKTGKLTRTIWLERGNPGLPPSNDATCMVPPFARTLRILRQQSNAADELIIALIGPGPALTATLETITLAGGTICPEIVLGPTTSINVFSPGTNAGNFPSIAAIFSIESGGEA